MAEKKSGIDQALIRDLANILNETDLTEIEVEQDELRIRVSRSGPQMVAMQQAPAYQIPAAAAAPVAAAPAIAAEPARNLANAVTAPMVRTAYLAPALGARPFI